MPTPPQPPRKNHPARPPAKEDEDDNRSLSSSDAKSYGQSAPMPDPSEQPIEGETQAPARKIKRVEREHESIEELASEPMREAGEDEKEPGDNDA